MIIKGLIIILAVAIAVRDICNYKISNTLLLMMTAVKCIDLAISLTDDNWSAWVILSSLGGALAGFVIFFSASMTKYRLGAGDVKYSAAVGFILGFGGYLRTMLIVCAAVVVYTAAVHKIRHNYLRGNFPLAPFIPFGLIITLVIG